MSAAMASAMARYAGLSPRSIALAQLLEVFAVRRMSDRLCMANLEAAGSECKKYDIDRINDRISGNPCRRYAHTKGAGLLRPLFDAAASKRRLRSEEHTSEIQSLMRN